MADFYVHEHLAWVLFPDLLQSYSLYAIYLQPILFNQQLLNNYPVLKTMSSRQILTQSGE